MSETAATGIYPSNGSGGELFPAPLDPDDDQGNGIDYAFDWSAWLDAMNDTIATFVLEYPDEGISGALESLSPDAKSITVWLTPTTAARPGASARIRCRVVTVGNRSKTKTGIVRIRDL